MVRSMDSYSVLIYFTVYSILFINGVTLLVADGIDVIERKSAKWASELRNFNNAGNISLYHHSNDSSTSQLQSEQPINILLILADDLGYGDTSVFPFVGSNIQTPELERMASRGMVMTNFHAAAPVCTPTRASILTGMFPWRMGIKAVYEYGEKGKSNRDDWLPQLPTLATVFRSANYTTGHSGKWHVGGMRNDDYDMRRMPDLGYNPDGSTKTGAKRCHHPGPNQQGFEEYVSVLDGPGAIRQNELQVPATLYSQGCHHLLQNDNPLGNGGFVASETHTNSVQPKNRRDKAKKAAARGREYLFDCEARHAIRMMKTSLANGKPFFVQVWFHAPHGPWEEIPEFRQQYAGKHFTPLMRKYVTMVSGMDRAVGTLLSSLHELGIERNTLVVFTSDNGPENHVGSTAGFRGNKRHLYEGGIRVPAIWQWIGTIPKGRSSSALALSTDLFPTFLDAAGIAVPETLKLDGMSLLPELVSHYKKRKRARRQIRERMAIWHTAYETPRTTAAILFDFKLILNTEDRPSEFFDLSVDPHESRNLLPKLDQTSDSNVLSWAKEFDFVTSMDVTGSASNGTSRMNSNVHKFIVAKIYLRLKDFANFGNEGHLLYLAQNSGREYLPTVESDNRYINSPNIYKKVGKSRADEIRSVTITNGRCSTPCPCEVPNLIDVPTLPFEKISDAHKYINPMGCINATDVLFNSNILF